MSAILAERLNLHSKSETPFFQELETEANQIKSEFEELGIWQKMDETNRIEPAYRSANIAATAAIRINEVAKIAGLDPLVSPKVTAIISQLYKSGQVIDEPIIDHFKLNDLNPHALGLYKYPAYVPERTLYNSRVLKVALLLHRLNHPWFAKAVIHGPHPRFFEGAELHNVISALANANLALNSEGEWHSYLHPVVSLLPIEPYAQRTDELSPKEAKDAIDRIRVVNINTTLQHVLRTHFGINFSDESYSEVPDELTQRWNVAIETFRQLGIPFPSQDEIALQDNKNEILNKWISENNIVNRLKDKQKMSGHPLYDHSNMVANLNRHLAEQINKISVKVSGYPILNEDYLYNIGIVHDSIKAFEPDEISWLQNLKQFEQEFMHSYPAEVGPLGTIDLNSSHDAQLYAWLRYFEETMLKTDERGKQPSIANDLLSGPYHLVSLISAIQSYSDLAVVTTKENSKYYPDITGRFLDTTLKYISDPHTAVNSYAKLMTVFATLSWYLGITFPQEGSTALIDNSATLLQTQVIDTPENALKNIQQLRRVSKIFGININ